MLSRKVVALFIASGLALVSCSSGTSSSVQTAQKYKIGGVVSGLAGSGLVLHGSFGEELSITANGAFVFVAALASGKAYEVTVGQQPSAPPQTCAVTGGDSGHGSGTVGAGDVTSVAVTCAANTYTVGGSASLSSGTVVLQLNGANDLSVGASGAFGFASSPLASGSAYAVTVKAPPQGQSCTVTGGGSGHGSGTVGAGNVNSVVVTCSANSYTVGGTASLSSGTVVLQLNGANDLSVAASGAFTFASSPLAFGSSYAVTAKTSPPGQTCTVTGGGSGHGSGTVGAGNVASVVVTCALNAYTVGGSSSMPFGPAALQLNGANDLTVAASGAFAFSSSPLAFGSSYAVTVKTPPQGQTCTVTGGDSGHGSGTVGAGNVTSVVVSCVVVVVAQRWEAPATWGAVWQDDGHMVQHAFFGSTSGSDTTISEQTNIAWSLVNGTLPAPKKFDGFPSGTRWGAGPFNGPRYQATANDAALDLPGDMLVCAIVKPDYNPTMIQDGKERPIIAKGVGAGTQSIPGGGWVLMQMHSEFCFHYQGRDSTGSTFTNMAYTPTGFADQGLPGTGPLNPSYVVICAGRSGNQIHLAANSYPATDIFSATLTGTNAIALDSSGNHHATIGGYDDGDPNHVFPGRVYETAVWNEPATPANIQSKLAAVEGLALNASDATPVTYTRNREGPFVGVDGNYHTTWRHGPRIDPIKGFLFGLQGWNRVSYCTTVAGTPIACSDPTASLVAAAGEALDLWTPSAGATVLKDQLVPPGDSEKPSAELVTLSAGASLSTALGAFDSAGPVHGQIWIQVPPVTTGTIRLSTGNPVVVGGVTGVSQHDVNLGTLTPSTWTRVWLQGLTTDGVAGTLTVTAAAANPGPVSFYAWGVDLTQIGGGGDLGSFDPGHAMYDWSAMISRSGETVAQHPEYRVDGLELPAVPTSTASTGFCLSVDAQPYGDLGWTTPFSRYSGLMGWIHDSQPVAAQLFAVGGTSGTLCFSVTGATGSACWLPTWAAGSKHNIKGCLSATGQARLYADNVQVGTTVTGVPVPDLAGGHVVVGNNGGADYTKWTFTDLPSPWNGFISKALACRDLGVGASTATCQ